jgi:hypothetical protein
MKRMLIIALTVAMPGLAIGLYAQHAEHQQAASKPAAAKPAAVKPAVAAAETPEVFCGTMKTGQLCSHGTPTALGLTPEQTKVWVAAVRTYNKAVNDATLALQADAKGTLSAAQMAEVDRWFAVGVNPQINQLLAAPSKAKGGGK